MIEKYHIDYHRNIDTGQIGCIVSDKENNEVIATLIAEDGVAAELDACLHILQHEGIEVTCANTFEYGGPQSSYMH